MATQQRVERVPRLVQQRLHVVVHADAVGEHERHPIVLELVLVAARRLATAAHQVEQVAVHQFVDPGGEGRIDRVHQPAADGDQFGLGGERAQRWSALRIDLEVPRAEPRQAQRGGAPTVEFAHRRHHALGDRVVQLAAGRFRVVVATQLQEAVRRVGGEAGVAGDVGAQRDQSIVDLLELRPAGAASRQRCAVGRFAHGPVLLLGVRGELLQGQGPAVELDLDAAHQALLAGLQFGLLALQLGVRLAEQLALRAPPPDHHRVGVIGQGCQRRAGQQLLVESVAAHLHPRHHLGLHREVGVLGRAVVGVSGHPHVATSLLGGDPALQLALVAQPAFELLPGRQWPSGEVVEQRFERRQVAGVEVVGHEGPGWRGKQRRHGGFLSGPERRRGPIGRG